MFHCWLLLSWEVCYYCNPPLQTSPQPLWCMPFKITLDVQWSGRIEWVIMQAVYMYMCAYGWSVHSELDSILYCSLMHCMIIWPPFTDKHVSLHWLWYHLRVVYVQYFGMDLQPHANPTWAAFVAIWLIGYKCKSVGYVRRHSTRNVIMCVGCFLSIVELSNPRPT